MIDSDAMLAAMRSANKTNRILHQKVGVLKEALHLIKVGREGFAEEFFERTMNIIRDTEKEIEKLETLHTQHESKRGE